jgi:hypothetical protein
MENQADDKNPPSDTNEALDRRLFLRALENGRAPRCSRQLEDLDGLLFERRCRLVEPPSGSRWWLDQWSGGSWVNRAGGWINGGGGGGWINRRVAAAVGSIAGSRMGCMSQG